MSIYLQKRGKIYGHITSTNAETLQRRLAGKTIFTCTTEMRLGTVHRVSPKVYRLKAVSRENKIYMYKIGNCQFSNICSLFLVILLCFCACYTVL